MRSRLPADNKGKDGGGTELLCPAGDFARLKAGVDFGADAVYLAGREFGMRTSSKTSARNCRRRLPTPMNGG